MGYIQIPNVPLLDEHLPASPRLPAHFGPKELQLVADSCNRLRDDTGDYPAIVLRHTGEENPNPPVVGYAGNFRVGDIGRVRPRKCLYCDWWIKEEHADTVRNHPRRSVEIWPDKWIIDPIAILGAEAPERYLGMLRFAASEVSSTVAVPALQTELDDMSEQEILEFVTKALAETPEFQFLRQQMEAQAQDAAAAAQPATLAAPGSVTAPTAPTPAAPTPAAPTPAAPMTPPVPDEGDEQKPPVEMGGGKAKYEANGGAMPSGTNTNVPDVVGDKKKTAEQYAAEAQAQSAIAARLEALEAGLKAEKEKAVQYAAEARKSKRLAVLQSFAHSGYQLDPAEELGYCDRFDDAAFDEHAKRIKEKYQRAPRGSTFVNRIPELPGDAPPPGGDPAAEKARVKAEILNRAKQKAG
jgi:hypothetical protein